MAHEPKTRARSQETRERILAAARQQFARDGYDRTTIRSVAAAAAIDAALVMRYFDSKDGLFSAAATFELALPDLRLEAPATHGRRLAEHFIAVWGSGPATSNPMVVLLRAAATNDAARERVLDIFRKQLRPALARVVRSEPDLRAALVATQVFGFAVSRFVLRLPPLATLPVPRLVALLGASLQRCLDEPL